MRALVTGITGQDAHYVSDILHREGHDVYGLIRGQANPRRATVEQELPYVAIIEGDLTDSASLVRALRLAQPDHVYNLGAISHVGHSFTNPHLTASVTGLGALNLLEAMRATDCNARLFQASTSEMFGKVRETPQRETTAFHPRSPYGCAKVFAHHAVVNYREAYGIHASCGIMFNHESPYRGVEFVTRKITHGLARIARGKQSTITLGNLDAVRDWGYAGDYMAAAYAMLCRDEPDDYVIATGVQHSVKDVLTIACDYFQLPLDIAVVDDTMFRPAEVDTLRGDASKAREVLGWSPTIDFDTLIDTMCFYDAARVS